MMRIAFCRKCYYLVLTNTQVSKLCKSFSNGFGANIRLSRTQLINKRKLRGFLVWFSKSLLRSWLPIIRKVHKPLAKSVLILLELTASVSATDVAVHKKMFGSGNRSLDLAKHTTLIMSNEKMKDIIKIVISFEESVSWRNGHNKTIKNETKEKREDFSVCYHVY